MSRPVVAAFLLSVALCALLEVRAWRTLQGLEAAIVHERAELQTLSGLDREVRDFQAKKDALQHRIDFINGMATGRIPPSTAAAAMLTIGSAKPAVHAARLVDRTTISVQTQSGTSTIEVKE